MPLLGVAVSRLSTALARALRAIAAQLSGSVSARAWRLRRLSLSALASACSGRVSTGLGSVLRGSVVKWGLTSAEKVSYTLFNVNGPAAR